jgi:RNA-directed DNA polymerase
MMSQKLTTSPEELRNQFLSLKTPRDLAKLLEVEYSRFVYHLYKSPPSAKYQSFQIPKKTGGTREISAPATALKIIQQKLSQVLYTVYKPKQPVHGFVFERNVVTNAKKHVGKKYVLNIDLKDFFPSINFGRVRGVFMAAPYNLNSSVATVLAQICCFNNSLPQGAPTSPIISNMICSKLDSQLRILARDHRCTYTRYVDDITFSTSMPRFPAGLVRINELTGQIEVGDALDGIIKSNGFQVNPKKVRLEPKHRRQEVTGVITNKFPNVRRKYVRQVRGMLHAWEKHGLEAAQKEFETRPQKGRLPKKTAPSFKQVVMGKIEYLGMVRGRQNLIYRRLRDRFLAQAPEYRKAEDLEMTTNSGSAYVVTSERSTWKHLKTALSNLQARGRFKGLQISFMESEDVSFGNEQLLSYCSEKSRNSNPQTIICIFENVEPNLIGQIKGEGKPYRAWGNSVFSLVLPMPFDRLSVTPNAEEANIELFYKDSDIMRADSSGKRLYLSNEFDENSGKHKTIDGLNCIDMGKVHGTLSIIDKRVFDKHNKDAALSRNEFSDLVATEASNFDNLDFTGFTEVFLTVAEIIGEDRVASNKNLTSSIGLIGSRRLNVFLCHSSGDKVAVKTLYTQLVVEGVEPWLDSESLLPGQNWQEEIVKAVGRCDVFIACLSKKSVNKEGTLQKEIKYALDKADEKPEGTIFVIPLRLEECEAPSRLAEYQWVNYFEEDGLERLIKALKIRADSLRSRES